MLRVSDDPIPFFFWGTLQDEDVLFTVLPREPRAMDQTFSATLPGFQAYAIRDEAFPAICPCPGNNLGGVLYYPQERRDVICLHRFEENYTPFTMPVFRNGVPILAQVFINGDGFDVTNEVWTLEKFQASEKSEFLRDIRAFMAHAWAMGWVDRFR